MILFLNGWIFTLPITEQALPRWLTPVQVVHGIFLHEALLLAYIVLMLVIRGGYLPNPPQRVRAFGYLIAGLGALALLSAVVNTRPLKEFAGAGRYFLLAAYFFVAIDWTKRFGSTFVLRCLLLGIMTGGCVNLYYTFKIKFMELGGFPLLLGEQGPGGYLGISVPLSAWLMMNRRTVWDAATAIASGAVGLFAVSISFSKLAMLMAAAGAIGWLFVLGRDLNRQRLRKWYALVFLVMIVMITMNRNAVVRYIDGAKKFVDYKFRYVDKQSIETRSQYFLITAEIVANHPLFGVSYGAFYDAAMATEASKSSRSAEESAEAGARGESNPHSSILYYASANGVPGLMLILTILAFASMILARTFFPKRLTGKALWACLVFAYIVFGLTLPTLFNSSVLYLPVAVSLCDAPTRLGRISRFPSE